MNSKNSVIKNVILGLILLIAIYGIRLIDIRKDERMSKLETTQEVLIKQFAQSSQELRLAKIVDEKMGKNVSVDMKIKVSRNIYQLSQIKDIPLSLICGLIETESGWNPNALSESNAKGLMQVLPSTARPYLRVEKKDYDPNVLFDPSINVIVGISYVADLHSGHVEAKQEKSDDFTLTLHSYFWGTANTAQLYGVKDARVNVPNMSYPMRVMKNAQKYKELGLE